MDKPVNMIISELNKAVTGLPKGFYDTFHYTTTGKNNTHPITWGILSKILWEIPEVKYVAVDFHLNERNDETQRDKFQPDLVALSQLEPRLKPILFLDFESPNSSDMRIPNKDVAAYIRWSKTSGVRVPYLVITTLPNRRVDKDEWELRWTGKGQYNHEFKDKKQEVFENPFQFWYSRYKEALKIWGQEDLSTIYFININGKDVSDATPKVWQGR